jgi:hypothetical protein
MQITSRNELTITMTGREAIILAHALRYVLDNSTAQRTGHGNTVETFAKELETVK